MIPAILSVVFVIYLYQSLKQDPELTVDRAVGNSSDAPADELAARLRSLQSRVEYLANENQNEGAVR